MMFRFGHKDVIGLDIGSYAVKTVHLSKARNNWAVTSAAIVEISLEGADNPKRQEANTVRAIQNCLRIIPTRTNLAVCSVGGPEVAIRNFDFPVLQPEEMEKALMLEARQVCPFTTTDIVVDYNLVTDGRDRAKGYLVAATGELIRSKLRLSKDAHLNCTLMDVDALALLNCFKEVEQPGPEHGTAVLNIGGRHTTLAVEGNNGLPFVRNINYSGENVISHIAEQNDMSIESVRNMLSNESKEIPPQIQESLAEASSRLVGDINKTLRYYSAQRNSFDIERILVCGGFALFENLIEFLKAHLSIKVELWNPFDKMQWFLGASW